MSSRDRRGWQIILWLSLLSAIISAYYGYRASGETLNGVWTGIATSIFIATPVLVFGAQGQRLAVVRRLRRLPLLVYFAIRVALYTAFIIVGLQAGRLAGGGEPVAFSEIFDGGFLFSIGMAVLLNLIFEFGNLLGFRTIGNLLTGRYARPKTEQRVFLLIDMKDSTGMAERLGPIRFHDLLNDFFRDVADAALECGAEIHKYVGDEAILTWPIGRALTDGDVLACPFRARDFIDARRARYLGRFGAVPEFRASLHHGEIVAGQIGDVRLEIAYVGDTLNVAARLLEAAKTLGRDVLVSTDLLDRVALPADLAETLPKLSMRGRAAPLGVAALRRA